MHSKINVTGIFHLPVTAVRIDILSNRTIRIFVHDGIKFDGVCAFPGVVSKSSSKVEKTEEVRSSFSFPARSIAAIAWLASFWTDEFRPLRCWNV